MQNVVLQGCRALLIQSISWKIVCLFLHASVPDTCPHSPKKHISASWCTWVSKISTNHKYVVEKEILVSNFGRCSPKNKSQVRMWIFIMWDEWMMIWDGGAKQGEHGTFFTILMVQIMV